MSRFFRTKHFSSTINTLPQRLNYTILGYLGIVNAGSFGLFAYDKFQAVNHGWRVRERDLQLSALIGGWIGGVVAMSTIRHKSKKKSFQAPYFLCSAVNAAAGAVAIAGSTIFIFFTKHRLEIQSFIQANCDEIFLLGLMTSLAGTLC